MVVLLSLRRQWVVVHRNLVVFLLAVCRSLSLRAVGQVREKLYQEIVFI